ncbi:MAG: hypothetical protein AAF497_23805, partial [Planctomycetota bacterium]
LVGVPVTLGVDSATTDSQGTFTLTISPGNDENTVEFRANELQIPNVVYPFIAEKTPLLFPGERDVIGSVNNVIERPIYIPQLDMTSADPVDPNVNSTIDSELRPGEVPAEVMVPANSLELISTGAMFDGSLSITEVGAAVTPAALPENVLPDTIVTIQPTDQVVNPGDLQFTTPAPLTLPNRTNLAPGRELDLWSINPDTGDFEVVGLGRVSNNGEVIETVEGGINNVSWHFFAILLDELEQLLKELARDSGGCGCESRSGTSQTELMTGVLTETHTLPSYTSLGTSRSVVLTYDSLRANPQPITRIQATIGGQSVPTAGQPDAFLLGARLTTFVDGVGRVTAGERLPETGLQGDERFWSLNGIRETDRGKTMVAGVQADLRDVPSGIYDYRVTAGVYARRGSDLSGGSAAATGSFASVNLTRSPIGAGWSIGGVIELAEQRDGRVLMIQGDGTEYVYTPRGDGSGEYDGPSGEFNSLVKLPSGLFSYTTTTQTVYEFDADNRISLMTDRNGNETSYSYNNHFLASITDPQDLETRFEYVGGMLDRIVDPFGRETSFEHDVLGNLMRVTNPDGTSRTWSYDDNHLMVGESTVRGFQEIAVYNDYGRTTSATRSDGTNVSFLTAEVASMGDSQATRSIFNAPPVEIGSGRVAYF